MIHDEPEILRMSEVQLREVDWLWYPYIPFGKLTILQGDPGEGKTTLALRLAAACSAGRPMPGMKKPLPPFNVIYQTAEDGEELHCEEIIRAAAERRISRRTVNEAKKNISGIVTRKAGARWLWSMEKEDCNIAEVSLKEG